jgi:hypothetical protein
LPDVISDNLEQVDVVAVLAQMKGCVNPWTGHTSKQPSVEVEPVASGEWRVAEAVVTT